MKEITILSGKGGTGKTTITAALASLSKNAVLCDNDVDAADLHLILKPEVKEKHVFKGAWQAKINEEICVQCNLCINTCRFSSIGLNKNAYPEINSFKCEGCRLCERVCPVGAIESKQSLNNQWYVSETRFGSMVHAKMGPGEEKSGKLVSTIRRKAKYLATELNSNYIINDGPPGIGCTAISALSGTNLVLLVTEPSKSGLYDAQRLINLVNSFHIPILGVINKSDMNLQMRDDLVAYFKSQRIPVLAEIPFDTDVVKAMIKGMTIDEFNNDSIIAQCVYEIWSKIEQL